MVPLCLSAERNFAARDPNTCLLRLRQFGEALAQHVAAVFAIDAPVYGKEVGLLVLLQRKGHLDRSVADMLHLLRQVGNAANHAFLDTPVSMGPALSTLRVSRKLAVWLHRDFVKGNTSFKPVPIVEPVATDYATLTARLQAQVDAKTAEAESASVRIATVLRNAWRIALHGRRQWP